jgi:hypothetical protein
MLSSHSNFPDRGADKRFNIELRFHYEGAATTDSAAVDSHCQLYWPADITRISPFSREIRYTAGVTAAVSASFCSKACLDPPYYSSLLGPACPSGF